MAFLLWGTIGFLLGMWVTSQRKSSAQQRSSPDSETVEYNQIAKIAEHVSAAITISNPAGRILYATPYFEVLTGFGRREALECTGDFFRTLIHEEDRDRYDRARGVTMTGEPFLSRVRVTHHSGIEMWIESRSVPLFDARGDVEGAVTVSLDVTTAMRTQRELEIRNRDLREMTSMVSHDLRGPLVTIRGMIGALTEELPQEVRPSVAEYLTHVTDAIERLDKLIEGVLQFARLSAQDLKQEPVSLEVVAMDLRKDMEPRYRDIGASLVFAENLPWVMGEYSALYRVFANLIENALKYRRPEVPLTVEILVLPPRDARHHTFIVRDNGRGIAAEQLRNIFRPFHRGGEKNEKGFGLGLASVDRLVTKLGGSIDVTSTPGEGSTFEVTLRAG